MQSPMLTNVWIAYRLKPRGAREDLWFRKGVIAASGGKDATGAPELQLLYGGLTGGCFAAAVAATVPGQALSALGLMPSAVNTFLFQRLATQAVVAAAIAYSLFTAAAHDRLSSATYRRLNLSLLASSAFAVGGTAVGALRSVDALAVLRGTSATAFGVGVLVAALAGYLGLSKGGKEGAGSLLQSHYQVVFGTDVGPSLSGAYQVALWLQEATILASVLPWPGGSLLASCAPSAGAVAGAGALAFAYGAAGMLSMYAMTAVRDAIPRGRAGASTFKYLQLGVGMAAALQAALVCNGLVTGTLQGCVVTLGHLAAVSFVAAVNLFAWLTVKK